MKKYLFFTLLLSASLSFSQGIVVDVTAKTVPQLIQNVLMQNSCSTETNFKSSSHDGIGEFTNTNPNFPFQNGIIIRNGLAKNTEGTYTGINESSQISTLGDSDLQALSNSSGQSEPITDVSYIEFDFTSISNIFSFDFLFASNEYGEFQCGFSDVFGFFLTDLTTGIITNLAVIPKTSTAVSVKTIRDAAYNTSCTSSNANLFSQYNVSNPANSAINMRGETKLLTATSPVIPNRLYRIKLAIGDYKDSKFDSAVFIKGGSFSATIDLGPDSVICKGESVTLNSGLDANYTFSWSLNGSVLVGETNSNLIAKQAGTYHLKATHGGCVVTDEIILSDLILNNPHDLTVCKDGQPTHIYDLTQNNLSTLGLNPTEYGISYYASLADADANSPEIPKAQLTAYSSVENSTIYIKVNHIPNGSFNCDNLLNFKLLVNAPFTATAPPSLNICMDFGVTSTNVDLSSQDVAILNGLDSTSYKISYYTKQTDAETGINSIGNTSAYTVNTSQSPKTFWARMEDRNFSICFDVVKFDVILEPKPAVDKILNVLECSSYILPVITNGNYYTGPNKTGTLLHAGDSIDKSETYYIYRDPIAPSLCFNESSFKALFVDEITVVNTGCGQYIVPAIIVGKFYTASGGNGVEIPTGTPITTNQTIYYYATINNVVCRDEAVNITIYPLPIVDKPSDVTTCVSYQLPPLSTNNNYFTETGGTGVQLYAGDLISSSQDVYVFANNARCTEEYKFRVNIVDTSIYTPMSSCGSYYLPPIPFGNYYDAPAGGGKIIDPTKEITTSQTVYYYAVTTTTPNCSDGLKYDITINPLPAVDKLDNVIVCTEYKLPKLTNGNYFTLIDGNVTPLFAGDIISSSKTIFISSIDLKTGCTNETKFDITIKGLPPVESFTDIFSCSLVTLPVLTYGTYYTATGGPNGTGTIIPSGTVISKSQAIYIYNQWSDIASCSNETVFIVTLNIVDVGSFTDINECDSYTLPHLVNIGNYYKQADGKGPIIAEGTVLTQSTQMYVYAKVGTDRELCSDDKSFMVNISKTPVLTNPNDVEACGSFLLPKLTLGNYFSESNGLGIKYFEGDKILASQKMYIYATAPTNANCHDGKSFQITVYPLNDLIVNGGYICVDYVTNNVLRSFELISGLDQNKFTVEWYFNNVLKGTGPNYVATEDGTYAVKIIKNIPDVGNDCGYNPTTVDVKKSGPATATITVTAAFEDIIDIIVNSTGGFGSYEFQLDNGFFQTDNVFNDVLSGSHTITIKDTKGDCNSIQLPAQVLNYPHFFTPNGDSFNDTWNILGLSDQEDAYIYIFDRYGKFIKQINPASKQGWDGTYNGEPLPSSDYWFHVFYKSNDLNQEFKAHFSLKR